MITIPKVKLNNGLEIPTVGLGVYQSTSEETPDALVSAIKAGYRLIDTAAAYMNEKEVGIGIKKSGINREDLFIVTKLWMSDYGYEETIHAFNRSMKNLDLEYLDLYLLHWPVSKNFERTIESYRAIESLYEDGKIKAIGVCNFSSIDLENLIKETSIVPAINQIEIHPYFTQKELLETNKEYGIISQAWSPLGGVNRYWQKENEKIYDPFKDSVIIDLAEKYNKTVAQIILRWHFQNGVITIPKSVKEKRINENINIFDFELEDYELLKIDSLNINKRGGPNPEEVTPQMFDFKIED